MYKIKLGVNWSVCCEGFLVFMGQIYEWQCFHCFDSTLAHWIRDGSMAKIKVLTFSFKVV